MPTRNVTRVCLTFLALLALQLVPVGLVDVQSADAAPLGPSDQFGKSGARQWNMYNLREMVAGSLVPVLGAEPTLGIRWNDDRSDGKSALYQAYSRTMCLSWDDSVQAPLAPPMTVEDCTAPFALPNVDPILFTDFDGTRTFAGGLQAFMADNINAPQPVGPSPTNAVVAIPCGLLPGITSGPPPTVGPPPQLGTGLGIWPQGCAVGCSTLAFTDTYDGSDGWFPAGDACSLPGWDHETVAVGPWAYPPPAWATHDRAVYYCSQGGYGGTAACWVSGNGGLTFEPISAASYGGSTTIDPMPGGVEFTCDGAGGLHGHMRISRAYEVTDQATNAGPHPGHIYLPFKQCGGGGTMPGNAGVAWSSDNGISWNLMMTPYDRAGRPNANSCPNPAFGMRGGYFDPSVAPSLEHGWVYIGQAERDDDTIPADYPTLPPYQPIAANHAGAYIAMTKDNGISWEDMGVGNGACPGTKYFNVGALASPPVLQAAFAEVIVGDDDRAAFAFLGNTETTAESAIETCGTAKWFMYVAMTYDAGRTWEVDRMPDPVQISGIWPFGGGNPCRNLLDFNDIVTDKYGRVVISYTDGCTGSCAGLPGPPDACGGGPAGLSCTASVMRQTTGRGLFSKYDIPDPPVEPIGPTESGEGAEGPSTLAPPPEGATDTADDDEDGVYNSRDNCPARLPKENKNPDQKDTDFDRKGDACDADDDNDGFIDGQDNCPIVANPTQTDRNGDGKGDLCDEDADSDGKKNFEDNCWVEPNTAQENLDGDSDGDVCDLDIDGDGMPNAKDCLPIDKSRWSCMDQQAASAAAAEKALEMNRAKAPVAGNTSAMLLVGGAIILAGLVALMMLLARRK